MPHGPNSRNVFPMSGVRSLCFLKNIVTHPNIIVGDYTYYDDLQNPLSFESNVLYHFDFIGDQLIIGKFCAIASGVTFMMNGANHNIEAFSTFPFGAFGQGWEKGWEGLRGESKGDTLIGNDVWMGYRATIMPGVCIGDGAIIAANAVVTKNVEPYTIVGGNPATVIRKRFNEEVVRLLLQLTWWNWNIEKITASISVLCSNDVEQLKRLVSLHT